MRVLDASGWSPYRKLPLGAIASYVGARHLDRVADSRLRLPAVWQQFLDLAVLLCRQPCEDVFHVCKHTDQAHHRCCPLARAQGNRNQPVIPVMRRFT